jgi:hypothetical protein
LFVLCLGLPETTILLISASWVTWNDRYMPLHTAIVEMGSLELLAHAWLEPRSSRFSLPSSYHYTPTYLWHQVWGEGWFPNPPSEQSNGQQQASSSLTQTLPTIPTTPKPVTSPTWFYLFFWLTSNKMGLLQPHSWVQMMC